MWIRIANKFAKYDAKRRNKSENIPKSFRGLFFMKHPVVVCFKANYNRSLQIANL